MAINILVEPQNPPIAGDYTLDQAIQQACETPAGTILTLWEDTVSVPAAQQTSFIRHAGNTFQVQGSNESISGSLTAGINYIEATESAGVITLAWVTSTTGYAYNQAYGGIYNGAGKQLLRDVCILSGSLYNRGFSYGHDFDDIYISGIGFTGNPNKTYFSDTSTTAHPLYSKYKRYLEKSPIQRTSGGGIQYSLPATGRLNNGGTVIPISYLVYDSFADDVVIALGTGSQISCSNLDVCNTIISAVRIYLL